MENKNHPQLSFLMRIPAQLFQLNHKPLWQKTILGIGVIALLFVAWPLAVAAVYTLVVLRTMRQPQTRIALIAAMIIPALIMEFAWGNGIISSLSAPDTTNQQAQSPAKKTTASVTSNQVKSATATQLTVKVLQAVSGDTLDVDQNGQPYRIKLIGLLAPAMISKSTTKAECFGPESQMFLDSLLRGRQVKLEFDQTQSEDAQSAVVSRYVMMDDGTQVNRLMLEAGLARPDTSADFDLQAEFKAYAESAKAAKKGLWLNCDKPAATPTPTPPITPTKSVVTPTPTFVNPTAVAPIIP